MGRKTTKHACFWAAISMAFIVSVATAHAVPSFERQTGMSCTVCHTVFPDLTDFGRTFKLTGYTFSKSSPSAPWRPPLSADFLGSYTQLADNNGILEDGVAPFDDEVDSERDKINIPQEASIFYGGKIVDHVGALSQLTYEGTENDIALDHTDIRYSRTTQWAGRHLIYGFTINNAPSVQDVWNTTPAWGYPWEASGVAPTPAASAVIDGNLDQQVGGIGAYGFFLNCIYAEFSLYRTADDGITRPLAAGGEVDTVTDGAVPYWRVALTHQWNNHSFEAGAYGLKADIFPQNRENGPTNEFKDIAFDFQYQYMRDRHIFSLHSTWIKEDQDWDADFSLGNTSRRSSDLDTFKIDAGYFCRRPWGTLGGIIAYFSTDGDTDPLLYAAGPVTGSRTGSPDSSGFILEADYLWRKKYKFALQYTVYDKFNGSDSNYDGFGRDASDNNTLYALVWLMF